jgi:hypothetical protein
MAVDEDVLKVILLGRWNSSPRNRAVKVVALGRSVGANVGYVTFYKYIARRTLHECEELLGLVQGSLVRGADLYEIVWAPAATDIELKGYTQVPGLPGYPIGTGVPQWYIRGQCPLQRIRTVYPGQTF